MFGYFQSQNSKYLFLSGHHLLLTPSVSMLFPYIEIPIMNNHDGQQILASARTFKIATANKPTQPSGKHVHFKDTQIKQLDNPHDQK
jgi:hypothetical protein